MRITVCRQRRSGRWGWAVFSLLKNGGFREPLEGPILTNGDIRRDAFRDWPKRRSETLGSVICFFERPGAKDLGILAAGPICTQVFATSGETKGHRSLSRHAYLKFALFWVRVVIGAAPRKASHALEAVLKEDLPSFGKDKLSPRAGLISRRHPNSNHYLDFGSQWGA
jgi:hypothetical protein